MAVYPRRVNYPSSGTTALVHGFLECTHVLFFSFFKKEYYILAFILQIHFQKKKIVEKGTENKHPFEN